MSTLLEPKEVSVTTQAGDVRKYILSKIPAIPAREIISKYPTSNMPKIGDYEVSEATMLKLMNYVGIHHGDSVLRLETRGLVDSHVPDWETLAKLEIGMLEYNCSFFGRASSLLSFDVIEKKAKLWITQMLIDSKLRSSPKKQPRSKNSRTTTP